MKGFTLLETLIVIAILAILGTFAAFGSAGVLKARELENDARAIVAYLRDAQQRSITGADGAAWQVDFHNVAGQDYYEVISLVGVVAAHVTLKSSVEFNGSIGVSSVQFAKISGKPDSSFTVELNTVGESCPACRTVTVDANGLITY